MADKSIGTQSFASAPAQQVPEKRIRIAIIGTGYISNSHIEALARLPQFELVAGCDIKAERREWFRNHHLTGDARVYEDYRELLKKEKPDAVDICTPNGLHCPIAIDALKAGCHVMTEKPMAMNPAEGKKMCAAAQKAGKLLCVGFQIRYTPAVQMCRRLLDSGMLGDIMYVKIHALRRRGIPNWGVFGQKHLQGGGPLIDLGVHMIESAHYAMGEPKALAACGKTWTFMGDKPGDVVCRWPGWDYKTYTVEDLAVGQVRFENGVLMQIESSFCNHIPEDGNYWEIFGTKGSFSTRDKVAATDLAGTMLNMKPGFLEENPWPTDFVSKLRNFGDAILEGTPLCVPGEEGLEIQKILDGLYRSADLNGAEVTIK